MNDERSAPVPEVYIVIAHWNDEETTTRCLRHLEKIQYPNAQVIVIDSGSSDGSEERIQKNFPWVQVLSLPENRGHALAANAGAAATKSSNSRYLFFIDNDAFVEPGCLLRLVESVESCPRAAMASPLILSERKMGCIWYAGGRITFLGNARHVGMGKAWNSAHLSTITVQYAPSCALLIRRRVFEEIGGFSPEFVNYSEDLDLSIKVRQAGYSILFVPDARVLHGESRNVIRVAGKTFRDYYSMRNRLYVIRKYGTPLQKSLGIIVLIFWYAFLYGCLHVLRGEWRRTRALFRGVLDFLRGRMGWREL